MTNPPAEEDEHRQRQHERYAEQPQAEADEEGVDERHEQQAAQERPDGPLPVRRILADRGAARG
ncbi:hypothetical protein FE374_06220 [Georgenia yuyongxinii]|uniref:Uncharacterized protein n=1 Tax=Georgenia yuyongxinii TaxID=2589797 RepID=A0A5B8C111_9MICO|nr:hypothetical protein [Georgenia yuyongxinii]QDC24273.1 hypothetical protein FE374_06220 [Georgenia yuyongxinii]